MEFLGYGVCWLMPNQFYNLDVRDLFKMANARQNYYASKWGKYKPHIKRNNKATLDWLRESE